METPPEIYETRPKGVMEDPTDFRGSVIGGLKWNTVSSIAIQLTRFVSSLVLVRLLTPHDYGVAAMALLFSSLASNVSDFGLGSALIQRRSITEADRSTVFWTTVAIGLGLTVAAIALAWPIAYFFDQPRVMWLLLALSFSFLIGSFATTQGALLQRAMRYRTLSIRNMTATVAGAATGIAVAALGGGPWAFVAFQLALASVTTALLWIGCEWHPRFMYSRSSLRDLGGFGANITTAGIVSFVKDNADNILVGRFLGARALGLYGLAYNVILIPIFRIFTPLWSTLFAAFSRIQDDHERLARLWLRAARGVTALVLPLMLGLFVVAPDFVDVILGARWHDAIPVIRILGFVPVAYCFGFLGAVILMALNRTRALLYLQLVDAALAVVAFVIGLRWGIVGIAACFLAVIAPQALFTAGFSGRLVGVAFGELIRNVAGVAEAAGLMTVVCWACREGLIHAGVPGAYRLAVVIVVGTLTYSLATVWRNRELIEELRALRSHRSRSEPGFAPAG